MTASVWQSVRVRRLPAIPCALTIAGSDSGGGAGIQADLKTFAALGVHGTSVITCVTAQSPLGVLSIQPVRPNVIRDQLKAVFELPPAACKTGMLYSRAIIEAVSGFMAERKDLHLVVDPVMVATSGALLLQRAAILALCKRLLPLASVVTPNLDETRVLTEVEVREPEDMREAARILHARYGCAALIKGGHLPGNAAIDVFWDGKNELLLSAPRIGVASSHGTGCTYAAAIAGYLALGRGAERAVEEAKNYVTGALARARRVGHHTVLNHALG